ncbi:unnamed protein product [Echinostoma caproni]|uniref:Peptidase_M28 domain-containing protein n=1 Tax=Echinostoma caproni TaxID=27848 RepID=A0A183AW18_9TREM|nr:unnamed protein product [Echinostoma caproni]
MNPKIKPKIRKLFAGGSLFPCIIFYIVGLSWFLLLSQDELNNETYLSENALLVGQVVERFDDLESINQFYENARKLTDQTHGDTTKLQKWIAKQLDAIGLEVYMQNFTFSHDVLYPIKSIEGTNLYGIMRSPSGGRTEALLLTVPLHSSTAGSVALVLSLLKTLRQQIYWAKDIVVVFPESEYTGLLAWIEAYHGGEATTHLSWTELEGRSGNIQAGLNLEFTTPDIQSVDIFPEGVNGLLANLDLVNTVVRIAHKHSIQSVVNGQPFYFLRGDFDSRVQDVFGLAQAVWTQAPGSPAGLHGLLINYQIPAVTLRGPSPYVFFKSSRSPGIKTGKFLEGILRSLNNLQERMHQSFWYYLLPSPLRYISIGVYMPPVLILIGSLLIKYKMFLQDWVGPALSLTLIGEGIEQVDEFCYLGSHISPVGRITDEVSARIQKARLVFANLRRLWRRRDIRLSVKG